MGRRAWRTDGGQRRAGDETGNDRRPIRRLAVASGGAIAGRRSRRGGRHPHEGCARMAGGHRWRTHLRRRGRQRAMAWARCPRGRPSGSTRSRRSLLATRRTVGRRHGRGECQMDAGAARQHDRQRARSGHARCCRRRGWRQFEGNDCVGDHCGSRSHRRREPRSYRAAGGASQRKDGVRPGRHRDRPNGRIAVRRQPRHGHHLVEAARAVVAQRHRCLPPEAGRSTRPAVGRRCVAGVGLGAVREGRHPGSHRHGASNR